MRKLIVAAGFAFAALTFGQANAADLPIKSGPVTAAINWSGFYVGATVGGGVAFVPVNDKDCFACEFQGQDFKDAMFVGGGHIGWNWQLNPFFMWGVEADINGASFDMSDSWTLGGSTLVNKSRLDWWASLRGRAGLTYNNTYLYVTAGGAWAHVNASFRADDGVGGVVIASEDHIHAGIAAGAGAEYMFARNWIFRAEYLYLDFLSNVYPTVEVSEYRNSSCIGICRYSTNPSAQIGRVGLSYKFGGS